MSENSSSTPPSFIRNIIEEDIKNDKNNGKVITRFPPEPNGYLHIGHAKPIFRTGKGRNPSKRKSPEISYSLRNFFLQLLIIITECNLL